MAKLDIDFVLIDESVVEYGFRCLMSGAQLDSFKANPVLLVMHMRDTEGYEDRPNRDMLLPIGKWYDIRIEGGRLLAKPEFDDDDELAVRVEKKVIKGYLNGASIWIDPIAVSDDENLMIPCQCGPTITQWGVKESSIVDIPNCRNSLALRDNKGKLLKLNSNNRTDMPAVNDYLTTLLSKPNKNDMDSKLLAVKLGLKDSATEPEINEKLASIISASNANNTLATENADLKKKLETYESSEKLTKATALVDTAIFSKKLTAQQRDSYIKLAVTDYETTKAVIDGMPSFENINGKMNSTGSTTGVELEPLLKKSGYELYLSGELETLKKLSVDHFKTKYKEAFGVEYVA